MEAVGGRVAGVAYLIATRKRNRHPVLFVVDDRPPLAELVRAVVSGTLAVSTLRVVERRFSACAPELSFHRRAFPEAGNAGCMLDARVSRVCHALRLERRAHGARRPSRGIISRARGRANCACGCSRHESALAVACLHRIGDAAGDDEPNLSASSGDAAALDRAAGHLLDFVHPHIRRPTLVSSRCIRSALGDFRGCRLVRGRQRPRLRARNATYRLRAGALRRLHDVSWGTRSQQAARFAAHLLLSADLHRRCVRRRVYGADRPASVYGLYRIPIRTRRRLHPAAGLPRSRSVEPALSLPPALGLVRLGVRLRISLHRAGEAGLSVRRDAGYGDP